LSTVLVIGAGGSHPYGFPLGGQLIEQILALLPPEPDAIRPGGSAARIAHSLRALRSSGRLAATSSLPEIELAEFRSVLLGQQPSSIDTFLSRDFGQQTEAFRWIGKLAIAELIGQCEKLSTLDNPRPNRDNTPPDDWYRQFWRTLNIATADDFHDLPLKVISFNYDRSFDQFLAERLTAVGVQWMSRSRKRTPNWWLPGLEQLERLSVLHPYGILGPLGELPYGELSNSDSPAPLIEAAARIAVIGEERSGSRSDAFEQAAQWIEASQRLVFLGFGFDPINMERLGLASGLTERVTNSVLSPRRRVFATTFGLEWAERERVCARYFGAIDSIDLTAARSPVSDAHFDVGITKYLRRFAALT
jgi:hypothetical protein